jgi:phosphoglycolate phosphatase-like HAD superfamily hydrolase
MWVVTIRCRADHDAVLFDLDGVLVDSRTPFARSVNGALASHGLAARPEHELIQYLGPPLHQQKLGLLVNKNRGWPSTRFRQTTSSAHS